MSKIIYYGCGMNLNKQICSLIPSPIICCPILCNPSFETQKDDDSVSLLEKPVHISLSHIIFRYGHCNVICGHKNSLNCTVQSPVKSSEKRLIFKNGDDLSLRTCYFTKNLCFQKTENKLFTDSLDLSINIKDLAVEDYSLLIVNENGDLFGNGIQISMPHIKVEKVSVGKEHSLAQTSDGEVFSWGSGMKGQLGNGELITLDQPEKVRGLEGFFITNIASGAWHSLALSSCGDAYVWGWNDVGQLGFPSLCLNSSGIKWDCLISHSECQCNSSVFSENKSSTTYKLLDPFPVIRSPIDLRLFVCHAVSRGAAVPRSLERKSERYRNPSLTTESESRLSENWNKNKFINIQSSPLLLDFWPLDIQVKKFACGDRHSVFLLDDGTAWTCGWNLYGQLGIGCNASQDEPTFVMENVEDVFAGGWNTIFAVSKIAN